MGEVSERLGIKGGLILAWHQEGIFELDCYLPQFSRVRLLSGKGLCFQYLKMFLYLKKHIVMFLWIQVNIVLLKLI